MPAAYDTYDYPSYWEGRDYEHGSEVIAIKGFLEKIPKISKILEIGSGYGRLAPSYLFRAKKTILTDPSSVLLKLAKENLQGENIKFIHTGIENLPNKIRGKSVDVAILVRVLHHLDDTDKAFAIIHKLLKDKGYLILEFANKCHFKATFLEFLHGNFTFSLEIFPKDHRTKKSKRKGTIPFLNFHPDIIKRKLEEAGFNIIETRSVSNFRTSFLKNILPTGLLLSIEKFLQPLLAKINFGPSIFILVQKQTD
ncbi:class I SAM-dependent methyltransferase [Patescibacteria group bacterium]|nr:class I SAM-dependent methyltransferase [Patescibacteria group bacterium]MBU0777046.1 class I SAM-dependent methyltransferase [Patescibacteria group bacterium]MBU0845740.1 class I SAM-dependent methyltransferase [Patescibacteria group bacterium]MBU0923210.1 class I SAM-dependent methyltransferase [Patescibacteria group bacterium]MBU1066500.1 class I SAM-dependent methyltransferase [Patescibacteria group bacterium]